MKPTFIYFLFASLSAFIAVLTFGIYASACAWGCDFDLIIGSITILFLLSACGFLFSVSKIVYLLSSKKNE